MIRMRGHHLICLNFYRGEGYNQEFIENLDDVMRRAKGGEEIEVVEGADEICRVCPTLQGEKCVSKPGADAKIREMDAKAAAHLGVEIGSKVLWQEIKTKVMEAPKEWLAAFCKGCDWGEVCAGEKQKMKIEVKI